MVDSEYLPGSNGWSGLDGASGLLESDLGYWKATGIRLVLAVPIIPTSNGTAVGTLAGGASGAYNSYFTTLAQALVAGGEGHAILRLGWEFDGTWFSWGVSDSTQAANFASYFRQIVTTMRSVPGQSFSFDWNPAGGASWDITTAYPGDAYVDMVGIELYDQAWVSPLTSETAWDFLLNGSQELNWMYQFAQSHGKQMTLPEWGVSWRSDGHGLGDDPAFIDNVMNWLLGHPVAFAAYFDTDSSEAAHQLDDGRFTSSLSRFRADFG